MGTVVEVQCAERKQIPESRLFSTKHLYILIINYIHHRNSDSVTSSTK